MKDITKIDVIGKINFDWLDFWEDYIEIRDLVAPVIKENLIEDFRMRFVPGPFGTRKCMGGYELETSYTQMSNYDIDRLRECFKDSVYEVKSIGLNYDLLWNKIKPNVCLTIDYK